MKKKIILFLLCSISMGGIFAQIPNTFQYQAVVRNDDGSILSNMPLSIHVIIHQGTASGTAIYEEVHESSTNISGVVSIKIGSGVNRSRTSIFADIDWSSDNYFIETQIKRGDESVYVSLGTQQLLSVPYAKYAHNADNVHIKSPDGKTWKIKVADDGTITAEVVTE